MSSPSTSGSPLFDPSHPGHLADPYRSYALLRQAGRVFWADNLQAWLLSHHADISQVLRDPNCLQDVQHGRSFALAPALPFPTLKQMFNRWMLFQNPPAHTRLRGLVNKAFTPRVVDTFRPEMERVINGLFDRVAGQGRMDVISDLAYPLPITVIALLLGVPTSDHEQFKLWSAALAATLEPLVPVEALQAAEVASVQLMDYFRQLLPSKRARPGQDLLSALIHAEEQGQRLSTEELLTNAVLLLAAGHETTSNLIGNGVLALLRHPHEMERLRREPERIRTGVEEFLRYDSPVQMTTRFLAEEATIAGQRMPAGQEVFLLFGAGNRDPQVFDEPDRLDIARTNNPHLSFGGGAHYCVGAPLARLEAQLAIRLLLERFPTLQLAEEPQWRPLAVLRGLQTLKVTW